MLNKIKKSCLILLAATQLLINNAEAASKKVSYLLRSSSAQKISDVRGPLPLNCSYSIQFDEYAKLNAVEQLNITEQENKKCTELKFHSNFFSNYEMTAVYPPELTRIPNSESFTLRICDNPEHNFIWSTSSEQRTSSFEIVTISETLEFQKLLERGNNVLLISECTKKISVRK